MGRYIRGTNGFLYKYVYAAQPDNLTSLESWSGVQQGSSRWSLATQFYAPRCEAHDERFELIDQVGHLTGVYRSAVPPFDLVDDVESAIYQVGDQWEQVVRGIYDALPGPALTPDVAGGQSFTFRREDWPTLAERIGRGADPADTASLVAARNAAYESGDDDHLPFMAACALLHAVEHDLDTFTMSDVQPRSTNLWSVVMDYAWPEGASTYDEGQARMRDWAWARRVAYGWLLTFSGDRDGGRHWLQSCLDEQPSLYPARGLIRGWLWDDNWAEIGTLADRLLGAELSDTDRAEALLWRGEAAWTLGEPDAAREDAAAAAELGRPELRDALA